nr:integrin alpha-IIb isoform X2 [Geotrypetes seraphini]
MCPWQLEQSHCSIIEFDQTGDQILKDATLTMKVFKSHQWLGATVRVWKNNIMACAPLQHWNVIDGNLESGITPVGACYVTINNLMKFVEYSPCRDSKSEEVYKESYYSYDRRYCEAGFSLDITQDGKILMGAPGGYYFSGLLVLPSLTSILSSYNSQNPLHQASGKMSSDINFQGYEDSFLGFSVAFGKFTGDASLDFAVGVPNYMDTLGAVEIRNENNINKIIHQFFGEQVASYYGYALAVTDVNGDGRDDVLVGAPLFMERRSNRKLYEVGRVYLHLQKKASQFTFSLQLLTGTNLYGRFGSAIAPLGDMDQDGYQDVAIGAPFAGENERGHVYIYGGQSSGLTVHPTQVLESPFPGHSAFGFSLKGTTDVDENGYPDLLVGAFEADKVALYKAKAVISAKTQLSFTPDVLNPEVKKCKMPDLTALLSCFTIHVCVSVSGKNVPELITLNAEVQLDRLKQRFGRRTFFLDSHQPSKTVPLNVTRNAKADCRNFTAYLREESEFKDKLSPIVISLNCTLATSSSSETLQPILHGQTFVQEQTRILLDCGEDNVCIPDLRLSAEKIKDPLFIGDDNIIQIQFNASNEGEGAYETELYLHLPLEAHFVQTVWDMESSEKIICLPRKENLTHVVVCELGNPMKKGQNIRAGLQVSVSNLEEVNSSVTFMLQMKSKNSQNPNSAIELLQVPVAAMAKVDLRGSSVPAVIILPVADWEQKEDSKKPEDNGIRVMHIYELHNAGPGTVAEVDLSLTFPDRLQDDYFLYLMQIEADAGIHCSNNSNLNPLGLGIQPISGPTTNRSSQVDRKREKREAELPESELGQAEAEMSPSLLKEPVHLNCSTVLCTEVTCYLETLEKNQRVSVRIHSILWMQSFLKRPLEQFIIQSRVSYRVNKMPYRIEPESLANGTAM